jgi:hypothetical protein
MRPSSHDDTLDLIFLHRVRSGAAGVTDSLVLEPKESPAANDFAATQSKG